MFLSPPSPSSSELTDGSRFLPFFLTLPSHANDYTTRSKMNLRGFFSFSFSSRPSLTSAAEYKFAGIIRQPASFSSFFQVLSLLGNSSSNKKLWGVAALALHLCVYSLLKFPPSFREKAVSQESRRRNHFFPSVVSYVKSSRSPEALFLFPLLFSLFLFFSALSQHNG